MSFIQGAPLPDIKETTTKEQTAPGYYTDYLTGLSQAGKTALGKTSEELVAGLDPLQRQAYEGTAAAAGAYKPALTTAEQAISSAAAGVSPERIASFMSPYTKNVVDEMARLSEQNIQRNILPSLRMGMVGSGQLGSQRYAGALGQSLAESARTLTGQQYGALSEGYKTALDAALREMGQETQAAQTAANIAKSSQELGLGEMGALSKAGAGMQAYEQALLDAPLKTAKEVQDLLRGFNIPISETTTFTGPRAGAYQMSPLSAATGLLSLLGAAATGSDKAGAGAGLNALVQGIRSILGSTAPDIDWSKIDWTQLDRDTGTVEGAEPQE